MSAPEQFEVTIEKIVAGGDGLARREGRVVFVPRSVPGDHLVVETVERRRDYLRAKIVGIKKASPKRRQPSCAFYRSCGGCSLMHLDIEAQRAVKQQILLESLGRGGHLDFKGPVTVHSARESGYRMRARFHVHHGQRGAVVGFKERGSHRLVDIAKCLQISSEANTVLEVTREWIAAKKTRAREIVTLEVLESNIEPVAGEPGRILLHFVVKGLRGLSRREIEALVGKARVQGVLVSEVEGRTKDWRCGSGHSKIAHRVGDIDYRVSTGSFFQINRYLLDRLVNEAASSRDIEEASVIDLYCGVGLFTLPLAKLARRVKGIETSSSAIADARANVLEAGLDNVELIECSAGDYAERFGLEWADIVVADPPRGGLEPPVVDALAAHPPRELRYISCDPPALGRDAGRLARAGISLERLVLLDLFPNTHHFETVAVFRAPAP